MKSAKKMSSHLRLRLNDELKARFLGACQTAEFDQSDIVRELVKSAVRYFDKTGNLYPPWDLVASNRAGESSVPSIMQVHNGNGHQVMKAAENAGVYKTTRKGRKP